MFQYVLYACLYILASDVISADASSNSETLDLIYRIRRQAPCRQLEYTCANRQCIPSYNVCDGTKDCSDGSDETRTTCKTSQSRCPALAFECSYGACIDRELRCNGKVDCADGSDEDGCSSFSSSNSSGCGTSNFRCSNGQCIYMYDICDGIKNCNDGSDETKDLCKNLKCPSSSFQCDYGACMEGTVKCNGQLDCPDGSDEFGCSTSLIPTVTPPNIPNSDNRPTPSGDSCRLPDHPRNGVYVSAQCQSNDPRTACRNNPGTLVPHTWLLKYTCNANYSLTSSDSEYSICEHGNWKPPLECIKLCPPLKSLSVDVKCMYGGREITCERPMKPNTTAIPRCKQYYKLSYVPEYSSLLCLGSGNWNYPLFFCSPECGVSLQVGALTTLILNGSETRQGEYPWLAALYYQNSSDLWEQKCAGSLITPHIILTAAHCVVTDNGQLPPESIKVGLGKYYRDFYKPESHSVITDVREVVVPRAYAGQASSYALDIALLDLVVSVQVTAVIMPACVDWTNNFIPTPEDTGFVAGWGTTENSTSSETILSAQLSYVNNTACLNKLRPVYRRYVTHDKFCAESLSGGQVDKGDSGGGLTFVRDNLHFLIGVVSTKIQQVTSFSLFTDITNREHHTWLETEKSRLVTAHHES